jgi:hypothetical protein
MSQFMAWMYAHSKAIAGGLAGGLSVYFALKSDGMSADDWWAVLAAVAAGSGLTWLVPNAGIMTPMPKSPTIPTTFSATLPTQVTLPTSSSGPTSSAQPGTWQPPTNA